MPPATDVARFLAGVFVGEGSLVRSGDKRFRVAVVLGATDRGTVEAFQQFFGVGAVRWYPRRRAHYDDEIVWAVQSLRDLVEVVVPFMDEHLPPSYKREQYLAWREALLDYWEHDARFGPRRRR